MILQSGQPRKADRFSLSQNPISAIGYGVKLCINHPISVKQSKKTSIYTPVPAVYRILFQIHGSKFKPAPLAYLGQASEICKSHRVLFFCVRKLSLDCFFSFVIQLFHTVSMPYVLDLLKIIDPDVLRYCFF